jgi:DNA-binding NtrC family response regulator
LEQINILIVEKDITLAKELQELLSDVGFFVQLADSMDAVTEMVKKNNFDFILLDSSFPEISGVEIFRDLQMLNPDCKTILCFNSYSVQIKKIISELRVAATVQKPFELDMLIELVHNNSQLGEIQIK